MSPRVNRRGPVLLVLAGGVELTNYLRPRTISLEHREFSDGGKQAKITLANPGLELIDEPFVQEGQPVEWRFGYREQLSPLYRARIFASEPSFDSYSGLTLTLYAYDAVAKAVWNTRQHTWTNDEADITESDVIEMLAAKNGWNVDVEPTKNRYTEFHQDGMNDWAFIQDVLAPGAVAKDPNRRGNHYRAWFDSHNETLHFHPVNLDQRPKKVYQFMVENDDPMLISFQPRINTQKPNAQDAVSSTAADVNGDGEPVDETATAAETGGTATDRFIANLSEETGEVGLVYGVNEDPASADPASGSGDAHGRAESAQDEAELEFLEAMITVVGDPEIRANDLVSIWNVGQKLSGKYLVDEVVHTIGDGYVTEIKGLKDALPADLTGTAAESGGTSTEDGSPSTVDPRIATLDEETGDVQIIEQGDEE